MITGAQTSGIRREASVIPSKKGRMRPFFEVPIAVWDVLAVTAIITPD
jgi:hypothetical protein